jgi:hypothetical protein
VAGLNVNDGPIAEGIELVEPQPLMLGDQALILRGYERLQNDEGRLPCCGNGGVSRSGRIQCEQANNNLEIGLFYERC